MTTATVRTKPLNNNVLIEVVREDDGVSRTDENEVLQQGIAIGYGVAPYHLTASAGIKIDNEMVRKSLEGMVGKKVRWEQYAEGGQTFEEGGKTYALIPWWRLISYEDAA